jgi:hypothetical protein
MQKITCQEHSAQKDMECRCRLGYATVPLQKARSIYDYATAMEVGTLFPELNIPRGQYGPQEIRK